MFLCLFQDTTHLLQIFVDKTSVIIHWNTFQGSPSPSELSDGGINIKSAEEKLDDLPGGTHVHYDEL